MSSHRKLSTQILIGQLTVLIVVSAGGLVLFAQEARHKVDLQSQTQALTIAKAAAADPEVVRFLQAGDPHHELRSLAETIRKATGAAYVVVLDRTGIRYSHPDPSLIGQRVSEPVVALDGRPHIGVNDGSLGRSANGKSPIVDAAGNVVGEVSAGILERDLAPSKSAEQLRLIAYAALALVIGVLGSLWLARRIKRQTFGLELHAIAELLQEREAMLHGIREGVVTLDPEGNVSLVNDEARRLLGFGADSPGAKLDDLVPPGRLHDLLTGDVEPGDDEVVLTDRFCLKVNRMPVRLQGRNLGAVVTVRDRTEHVELLRELDSVASLTEALRGQQHEHANRMHTIAGLLELDRPDEAATYLEQVTGDAAGLAEGLKDRLGNATILALLLGKSTVARERGVELMVDARTTVDASRIDTRLVVTVVGNLLDNAVDAVAGTIDALVTLSFDAAEDGVLVIRATDNGPGLTDEARSQVFLDGYTTKLPRGNSHRGLGLALVHRLVAQTGGSIELLPGLPTTFEARLPLHHCGTE